MSTIWIVGSHSRHNVGAALCSGTSGNAPHPSKLMVIIGENVSQDQVNASASSFEQATLTAQCGSLQNMHALSHGSEPNYLGLTAGSYPTWALCDFPPDTAYTDKGCTQGPSSEISGPSLFGQLDSAYGTTGWRTYAESMATPCAKVDGTKYTASTGQPRYKYVTRHNPAVFYRDLASCRVNDIALGNSRTMKGALYSDAKAGKLPKVSFVIPDTINSGHDTSLRNYDDFLSRTITFLRNTPDYRSGALAIIVTFDEGDVSAGLHASVGEDCQHPQPISSTPSCVISAWVIGRDVPHLSDTADESHYSVLKTIERWAGLPLLGHAADVATNAIDPRLIPTTTK